MSDLHSSRRNACLIQLLLPVVVFGVLCMGASIVNYFHAKEVFMLLSLAFVSLVVGFLASMFLYSLLSACWLNSYLEREVKRELHDKYHNTVITLLIIFCSLIMFFGYFGEEVGKTWDNMDIGVRNDEWASGETPKKQSTANEASRATSTSSKDTHSDASSTSSNISSSTSSSGYKSSDVFDAISNYRPSHSAVSSETNTEADPQAKEEQKTPAVSERITDSDCECADGCEQEDFWITEEDDTTHNSSCARYGKGEGMYSAQGSGTDCTECDGANGVSQKTDASSSASAAQQVPDKVVYWVSLNDGLIHHPSCSQYCNGRGYYSTTPTAQDCPQCGGRRQMYWITEVNDKTHKWPCTWFGKYKGHYSAEGTGHNCQECGGAK